jgi:hypothetical protein
VIYHTTTHIFSNLLKRGVSALSCAESNGRMAAKNELEMIRIFVYILSGFVRFVLNPAANVRDSF